MSLTDHPAVPIAPRGLGIIKDLKHCSPDKGTAAELTDLHSKSVQVQSSRGDVHTNRQHTDEKPDTEGTGWSTAPIC